jgi:hypothetical protein
MFASRKFKGGIDDIPVSWIFRYYLNLSSDLNGKSIRINSIFNPTDRTPSMFIYYDRFFQSYMFKCHSTGKFGNAITFVKELFNISHNDACNKIQEDYYRFCETGVYEEPKIEVANLKWTVQDYIVRSWNTNDAEFWLKYNIGSSMLEKYRVFPIACYTAAQINTDTGEVVKSFDYSSELTYAYFTGDNIYKIYNPKNKNSKFFTFGNYLQGEDQLEGHDTLIITSSLKDLMSIKSLGLTVDCVAPSSETAKLKREDIEHFKLLYSHVIVCMDSDAAGIASMKYYEETYNLPFIYLPREKDISDIIKHHGKDVALYDFYPKLQRAIEKYVKKNS